MKKIFCLLFLAIFCLTTNLVQAEDKKLLIVGEGFPPFEFTDESGNVVGIDIDIAKHIFAKLGVNCTFQIHPWARVWQMIQDGKADACLSTSKKPEREAYLYYPQEDMWKSEFVFFVRKENKKETFNGYEDAKKLNLKIGIIRGNSYHDSFWNAFPYQDAEKKVLNAQLDEAVDMEINLKKLAARGRTDLYIVDRIVGLHGLKKLGLQDEVTYYDTVLFSKGYPMPFAKNSSYPDIQALCDKFSRELAEMKRSGEYDKILQKWLK